jgi:hypothetical protein
MFQSFQSSSAILDPVANPELFQSKLAVIIKVHLSSRGQFTVTQRLD